VAIHQNPPEPGLRAHDHVELRDGNQQRRLQSAKCSAKVTAGSVCVHPCVRGDTLGLQMLPAGAARRLRPGNDMQGEAGGPLSTEGLGLSEGQGQDVLRIDDRPGRASVWWYTFKRPDEHGLSLMQQPASLACSPTSRKRSAPRICGLAGRPEATTDSANSSHGRLCRSRWFEARHWWLNHVAVLAATRMGFLDGLALPLPRKWVLDKLVGDP